jgi:hypothetical protein
MDRARELVLVWFEPPTTLDIDSDTPPDDEKKAARK